MPYQEGPDALQDKQPNVHDDAVDAQQGVDVAEQSLLRHEYRGSQREDQRLHGSSVEGRVARTALDYFQNL